MAKKMAIQAQINGEEVQFLCEPRQSLLEVLRETLGLTGAKEGCNNGNCGACNVILDGVLVNSCLVLAVEIDGRQLTTIEGIAGKNGLHPLQQKFLEYAALQCGICTPGFILASKALLDRNPNPTESEVRRWLAGNLCRCTGYDKIVHAVLDAAAVMRGADQPAKGAEAAGAETAGTEPVATQEMVV
ncbi:MAG TPA: (2Fe-2S)-binding protein [Anaerolineaceae bacterium]